MSFVEKLVMPKKLRIAAYIMMATLAVASAVEYFIGFHTLPFVRTIGYYLVLDYIWTSIKREWLNG